MRQLKHAALCGLLLTSAGCMQYLVQPPQPSLAGTPQTVNANSYLGSEVQQPPYVPGDALPAWRAAGAGAGPAQFRAGPDQLAHPRPGRPGDDRLHLRQCGRAAARRPAAAEADDGAAAELQPEDDLEEFPRKLGAGDRRQVGLFMPQQAAGLTVEDLKETTRQFQALIADARKKGLKARAIGSSWSLSHAPATERLDAQHQSAARPAEGRGRGYRSRPIPATPTRRHGLYLFQCGNTVAEVNKADREQGARSVRCSPRARPTARPSSARPPAGTHGSALDFGALHDHIVAIHLMTAPATAISGSSARAAR